MSTRPVQVKKTTGAAPDALQSLRGEMDKLFERFAGGFALPSLRGFFEVPRLAGASVGFPTPAVDVTEDEKAYTVTAELPGLEEKDVEVTVSGDSLLLKGEKRQETENKSENYYLSERSYGSFQRILPLPTGVDRDAIAAQFAKGVLKITLPKTADAQKRQKKIEIKAS